MSNQLQQILDGYTNLLRAKFNNLDENTIAIAKERYTICLSCPYRNTLLDNCKRCGCYLPAKTRTLGASCPIGKWVAKN